MYVFADGLVPYKHLATSKNNDNQDTTRVKLNFLTGYRYSVDKTMNYHGACRPAAITGTTIQAPCHVIKSLQLIWRSGTRRWNLQVPDLPMRCSDLT